MNEEFSKGQLLQMDIWTRINSTFAGHYDLAAYLSCVLIIIAGVGLVAKNRYLMSISLIIFLLGFHILTLTASRVSIFAFWGGIIITLLAVKKYLWIFPISTLVIFSMFNSKDLNQRLLATIPAIKIQINKRSTTFLPTPTPTLIPTTTPVIAGPIPSSPPRPVFTPTPTPTIFRHKLEEFPPIDSDIGVARSGEIRFNVEWPRAINAFRKNYLLGSGLGSITLATDNDYLRLLGESGLFGFISFLAIFLFFSLQTIAIFFKKKRSDIDNYSLILFGALVAQMANAIFIDVFEASKTAYTFWIIMGIYYRLLEFSHSDKR